MMEWLKTDREVATANYEYLSKAIDGSLPEKGIQLVIEEAKKVAKVVREISLSEVEDLSILKEAQRELGTKGSRSLFGLSIRRETRARHEFH
jgi:hypothetical protein